MFRALPVIIASAVAMAYVAYVEWPGPYIALNFLPMLFVIVLALTCLYRGHGQWSGSGFKWPLGTLGFALSAIGVSLYLHYGYATDRGGMVSEATRPVELFRYLPVYALFAGATGFSIGWIAGRDKR
ncbi:MAG TPA: hypothetical protein VKZ91_06365 [Woeseiaceae bacterium]|nr:hypothetical protein [Woeseiaceae bacterium]